MFIRKKIIGLIIIILIFIQIPSTYAIFSPIIASEVEIIKQHVREMRRQYGIGSFRHAINKVIERDKELRARGEATGMPSDFNAYLNKSKENAGKKLLLEYLDSFTLFFNYSASKMKYINSCLRDDLWALEDLQEAVLNEALRASLLFDESRSILWKDYQRLTVMIDLLKGIDEKNEKTELLFGEGATANYYTNDCPYGEFQSAFEDLANSWKTFATLASAQGSDWGNIWEMAEKRSRKKAREWIKSNQITLRIGGEAGANPTSLIKEGWAGLEGSLKTQLGVAEDLIEPLTVPLFKRSKLSNKNGDEESDCVYYHSSEDVWTWCTKNQLEQFKTSDCLACRDPDEIQDFMQIARELQWQETQKEKNLKQANTAIIFNLLLNNIGEKSLVDLDGVLLEINAEIKKGFEGFGKSSSLPTFCKNLLAFANNHCPDTIDPNNFPKCK